MSSLLGGQPGKSPRTRGCRASGKAAGRALRGGGALTPDSNSGSKARSCGQAQSLDVVSPTDSAKTAPADADIGQWSGRTRTSPPRGAVSTFSSWPAAGSPAPTGAGLEDLERAEGRCFDTATTCRGADEVAAQAIDNEWGPGASETCGSVLNQAVNQPGDGLRG